MKSNAHVISFRFARQSKHANGKTWTKSIGVLIWNGFFASFHSFRGKLKQLRQIELIFRVRSSQNVCCRRRLYRRLECQTIHFTPCASDVIDLILSIKRVIQLSFMLCRALCAITTRQLNDAKLDYYYHSHHCHCHVIASINFQKINTKMVFVRWQCDDHLPYRFILIAMMLMTWLQVAIRASGAL